MNSNKNLVFLGMMGSGKSSIGNLVSKKLDLPFTDIDSLIVKNTGMNISEIFEKKGEDYFRKLEEKITLRCLKKTQSVVSLGGGGFINAKIREEILANHFSFWLNWDESILIKRIKNIVSLGGGGFINTKIRKEILANHFSFWLNLDASTLITRIKGSKKRPLVFRSTDHEIRTIIKKRSKIYSNAQFKINCNKLTKTEIVKKIIKIYELC